jgi:hypothetical protein
VWPVLNRGEEAMMAHLTYYVVRQPGGWAVKYDSQVLCCFRTQEQAIAQARLLGRERGEACDIQVQELTTGRFRTEVTFGNVASAV